MAMGSHWLLKSWRMEIKKSTFSSEATEAEAVKDLLDNYEEEVEQ